MIPLMNAEIDCFRSEEFEIVFINADPIIPPFEYGRTDSKDFLSRIPTPTRIGFFNW